MPGDKTKNRRCLPEPADRAAVALFWEKTSLVPADAAQRALVEAMAGGSPFLRQLMLADADFAKRVLAEEPGRLLDELVAGLAEASRFAGQAELQRALRLTRARAALLIAAADLAGLWTVDEVTAALTRFADAALNAALDWLLREGARTGKLTLADEAAPATGCGYVVLAMGKHGAHELNYSSDIDLIVLYDLEAVVLASGVEPAIFFVRLTKRLVGLLQDVTEDGYAFRVDLRLRPDPRATQVAISIEAAAIYYESMGQNWERAAMIKAQAGGRRPGAGCRIPRPPQALYLAQISGFRRNRRRAVAEAPDSRGQGPRLHRGHGPQYQARPRRHPRDRIFRADPAIDRRRPQSEAARPRHARHARCAGGSQVDRGPRRRMS